MGTFELSLAYADGSRLILVMFLPCVFGRSNLNFVIIKLKSAHPSLTHFKNA
jgi:hypothetical protein